MSIYPKIWETNSELKWIFAAGDNVPEAMCSLAGYLAEHEMDDLVIAFDLIVDNDGVAVGALIEE